MATTRTEDGHKPKKRWRDQFILRIKEEETHLILHEQDDNDDGTGFLNVFKTVL